MIQRSTTIAAWSALSPQAKRWGMLALCLSISVLVTLFWPHVCHAADGQDLLANASKDVDATFGANSQFKHFILLLEFFACVWAWHKTKNPGVLTGIIILIIFLNFGFAHLVGTGA